MCLCVTACVFACVRLCVYVCACGAYAQVLRVHGAHRRGMLRLPTSVTQQRRGRVDVGQRGSWCRIDRKITGDRGGRRGRGEAVWHYGGGNAGLQSA